MSTTDIVLCSDCFQDQGLRLDAAKIGMGGDSSCPNCGSVTGMKLDRKLIEILAQRFFVWGTLKRYEYGGAPAVQMNEHQTTSIRTSPWFGADVRLIESTIGVGFFYYGPRLWMVGKVEPLKALQDPETIGSIIGRIIAEYPAVVLPTKEVFYRIRKSPTKPDILASTIAH
jgi:hypothetical protein